LRHEKVIPIFVAMTPLVVHISYAQSGTATGQAEAPVPVPKPANPPKASAVAGRRLFLKNCAHCHGADARGDEGPDLHGLDWTDQQIANRVRNGKKGQMTAFAGKLGPGDIDSLIAYVRTLK
jgi:mono/diheme cytochrome c family protein